jgi:hypothetical protein
MNRGLIGSIVAGVLFAAGTAAAQPGEKTKTKTTIERKTTLPADQQQGQAGSQAQAPGSMQSSAQREVVLRVEDIDREENEITFESHLRPGAQVYRDGQPIPMDQLQEGDQVRAAFDPQTGDVVRLELVQPASPARPAQPLELDRDNE